MHNTVADGYRQLAIPMGSQEGHSFPERRRHVWDLLSTPSLIDKRLPRAPSGEQTGMSSDPLELTSHAPLELVIRANGKDLELDAGTAGIDHKYRFAHRLGSDWLMCTPTMCKKHGHGTGGHTRPQVVGS
ncbi:protein of unknown function [Candidatus Filomicrobium marinum]|nr:protein of unknown function [Candidatus Filomicrobium marinum]